MPVSGTHRSISSRPNCGLCRLPGNDRTSATQLTWAPSSKDANSSEGSVPCPTVYSMVIAAIWAHPNSRRHRTAFRSIACHTRDMAETHDRLDDDLQDWITAQHVFFV